MDNFQLAIHITMLPIPADKYPASRKALTEFNNESISFQQIQKIIYSEVPMYSHRTLFNNLIIKILNKKLPNRS